MRKDMLFEQVARHLRIDATIVGRIVGQPVRDAEAKGCRKKQQTNRDRTGTKESTAK
jgi:hypothetical protein